MKQLVSVNDTQSIIGLQSWYTKIFMPMIIKFPNIYSEIDKLYPEYLCISALISNENYELALERLYPLYQKTRLEFVANDV